MLNFIKYKFNFFKFILSHPLTRENKCKAVKRFIFWQIKSRLFQSDIRISYVDNIFMLCRSGMVGATGNIYTGLHEFEDMGFVLHFLRPGDLFVDIGANVGSYSLLGLATRAKVIAIEPIKEIFSLLMKNIIANDPDRKTRLINCGVGAKKERLKFTNNLDSMNHVLANNVDQKNAVSVSVRTLDELLFNDSPLLIKIDVEGYEQEVIKGANKTLSKHSLLGIIIELNESSVRYKFDDNFLDLQLKAYGFKPFKYSPKSRKLTPLKGKNFDSSNTLYLRNIPFIKNRIKKSRKYWIANVGKFL